MADTFGGLLEHGVAGGLVGLPGGRFPLLPGLLGVSYGGVEGSIERKVSLL